jgi:hypothetical protein
MLTQNGRNWQVYAWLDFARLKSQFRQLRANLPQAGTGRAHLKVTGKARDIAAEKSRGRVSRVLSGIFAIRLPKIARTQMFCKLFKTKDLSQENASIYARKFQIS